MDERGGDGTMGDDNDDGGGRGLSQSPSTISHCHPAVSCVERPKW